ncbi:MAG: DUF1579 domain-containing protein [Planctomycetota bacterium]
MRRTTLGAFALLSCYSLAVRADDIPNFPGPVAEHELLQRFVGTWDSVGECSTGPDSEPMINRATMTSRSVGGRWVVNEMDVDAGGMPVTGLQTLGYDPAKQKYVGTWVDSMQNHLWVYEGDYDPATKTLVLHTMGPNMMGDGELIPFRDSYEFVSDDEIISRSEAKTDGEWVEFMKSRLTRKPME